MANVTLDTKNPRTLQEAIKHFADADVCLAEMVKFRWGAGPVACPTCGSVEVFFLKSRRVWECKEKHAKRQFSVKVGTIMEDSAIGLDKWLVAMWLIANAKNGISSYELARAIGVTQKSAWFMLHRIRLAMQDDKSSRFAGHVEADETFIGGRGRNMHKDRKARVLKGRQSGVTGKVAVMGLLQRNSAKEVSQVRLAVVPNVRRRNLQGEIRKHVVTDGKTTLYSDALKSYEPVTPKGWRPSELYIHQVIDHAEAYAKGAVHTNGMENFWSLLKRTIKGTYVSVEPFHLFRYLDEQAFRFNKRKLSDFARFAVTAASVFGKRLTFNQLTAADTTC
jgi:transposase-like protein